MHMPTTERIRFLQNRNRRLLKTCVTSSRNHASVTSCIFSSADGTLQRYANVRRNTTGIS